MKKVLMIALALVAGFAFVSDAQADSFGFDIGTIYFDCGENVAGAGSGSFFAISLIADDNAAIGFYSEKLGLKLKDDQTTVAGTTVNINGRIAGIQGYRRVVKDPNIFIGIRAGMADLSATGTNDVPDPIQWNSTAPIADVFVKWDFMSGGKKVKSACSVIAGYRFMMVDAVDPDVSTAGASAGTDFVDTVDNLSGVFVGVSVGISF